MQCFNLQVRQLKNLLKNTQKKPFMQGLRMKKNEEKKEGMKGYTF